MPCTPGKDPACAAAFSQAHIGETGDPALSPLVFKRKAESEEVPFTLTYAIHSMHDAASGIHAPASILAVHACLKVLFLHGCKSSFSVTTPACSLHAMTMRTQSHHRSPSARHRRCCRADLFPFLVNHLCSLCMYGRSAISSTLSQSCLAQGFVCCAAHCSWGWRSATLHKGPGECACLCM